MCKSKATSIQSKAVDILPYVKQFMPSATKGGIVAVYNKFGDEIIMNLAKRLKDEFPSFKIERWMDDPVNLTL